MLVVASIVVGTTLISSTSAFAATLPSNSSVSVTSSSVQSVAKTTSNSGSEYGQVSNLEGYNNLNLRQGPGTSYTIIGDLANGTKVKVLSKDNGWYKIEYNGTTGYVYGECINIIEGNSTQSSNNTVQGKTGTVINVNESSYLNFRSGPSTSYTVIGKLSEGTTFTIISESNGWYKINYNGTTGYVDGNYVSDSGSNSSSSNSSTGTSSTTSNSSSNKTGTVTNLEGYNNLNLRQGAGTSYSIIGELPSGATVTVLSQDNGWDKVSYNGTTGYVYGECITIGGTASSTSSTTTSSTTNTTSNTTTTTSSSSASSSSSSNTTTTTSTSSTSSTSTYASSNSSTAPSDLVDFTASYEGFSSTPYYSGGWTVGFGQNYGSTYPGDVTYSEALATLQSTLTTYREQVISLTEGLGLNANQINALTDFAYNTGIGSLENSQLLQDIESGNTSSATIMSDFQSWSYADGSFSSGLYARRTAEANMFLYGEYTAH